MTNVLYTFFKHIQNVLFGKFTVVAAFNLHVLLPVDCNLVSKTVKKYIRPLSKGMLIRFTVNSDVVGYICSMVYFCMCQNNNKHVLAM